MFVIITTQYYNYDTMCQKTIYIKFQCLASGTLPRARNTIFPNIVFLSETRCLNKMCSLSVQNVKICYEQISVFVKVFRYDTYI